MKASKTKTRGEWGMMIHLTLTAYKSQNNVVFLLISFASHRNDQNEHIYQFSAFYVYLNAR